MIVVFGNTGSFIHLGGLHRNEALAFLPPFSPPPSITCQLSLWALHATSPQGLRNGGS